MTAHFSDQTHLFKLEALSYLAAQELSAPSFAKSPQEGATGPIEAFNGLAALLADEPGAETYDTLAHAACRLAGAKAAWLLIREGETWTILGRAVLPPIPTAEGAIDSPIRVVPLVRAGAPGAALALWPASSCEDAALEAAFEEALAAALRSRSHLEECERLSCTDPLTSLANRRALTTVFPRLLASASRNARPLSVLMLDLDEFKRVNDVHGHEAGDLVLATFSRMLVESLRQSDLAIRYGGEEVLAVLPDTGPAGAWQVAEKIRERLAGMTIATKAGPLRVTVSVGVATREDGDTPDTLVARADEALYVAKAAGRNCCRSSGTKEAC